MFKWLKKYIIISIVFLILIIFAIILFYKYRNPGQPKDSLNFKQAVASASLLLAPAKGIFYVGDTISIALFVNASEQPVNMFEGKITFPQDKLEAISLSKEDSIINLWIKEPSFSNQDGVITLAGGLPSPGFIGVAGKIITMSFKVKSEGDAVINIEDASLLANDGYGTDILKEITPTTLTLLKPKSKKDIADINGDNKVNLIDVSILIANLGTKKDGRYDLNNDGKVDMKDLSILLSKWSR